MERETGIEPATNSLEGCDSTTGLLPPTRRVPAAQMRVFNCSLPPRFHSVTRHPKPARSIPGVSEGWWRGKDSNLRSR